MMVTDEKNNAAAKILAYLGILIFALILFFLANKAFSARFEMVTPEDSEIADLDKQIAVSTLVDFQLIEDRELITLRQLKEMIDQNNEYIEALKDRNAELMQDFNFIKRAFNLKVRGPK